MSRNNTFFLPDLFITMPAILLLSLGSLVIYSSDPKLAIQQIIFAIVGFVFYWLLSLFDFEYYQQFIKYFYIGILFLLIVVFILGVETRGSVRWIQILGWQFQPSELAKPILILFLARFWSSRFPNWKNVFLSFLVVFPVAGLIFKQPDLGTALTIIAIWLTMLIGTNISIKKITFMGFVSIALAPVVGFFLKDYQKDRILSFLSPGRDPLGMGYNVIQSMIAAGSGEFLGRGLGRGTQSRLQFLPEFRTDFIFASIAEELGFITSMAVLILYGILIVRGFKIISNVRTRFNSLLVLGVLGMLFFQITVNIGMNVGIMPVTGITLPLLSYGGSSLVSILISLSFIASAARFAKTDRVDTLNASG